jgi:hypothetical protein
MPPATERGSVSGPIASRGRAPTERGSVGGRRRACPAASCRLQRNVVPLAGPPHRAGSNGTWFRWRGAMRVAGGFMPPATERGSVSGPPHRAGGLQRNVVPLEGAMRVSGGLMSSATERDSVSGLTAACEGTWFRWRGATRVSGGLMPPVTERGSVSGPTASRGRTLTERGSVGGGRRACPAASCRLQRNVVPLAGPSRRAGGLQRNVVPLEGGRRACPAASCRLQRNVVPLAGLSRRAGGLQRNVVPLEGGDARVRRPHAACNGTWFR